MELILGNITQVFCSILYFINGLLFYRLLCSMILRKKSLFFSIIIYITSVAVVNMIIYANDLFNITLALIWFTAALLLAFQGRLLSKLAVSAILYPLPVAFNFLIVDVFTDIFIASGDNYVVNCLLSMLESVLRLLFWSGLLKIFKKRLNRIVQLYDDKTWLLLGTVCLASMVSITTCVYFAPAENWKMWPCAVACIVTNIGSLYLADYFSNSIRHDMERKNLVLQKNYYEELEQNQTEIRKLRHDMKNHLAVIRSLFLSESREEADAYFQKVDAQITATNRVFCKNSIVNAVLNAKYNQAIENGIDCFFNIDLQNVLAVDPVSLCSLFANTLDNAIEASLKIPASGGVSPADAPPKKPADSEDAIKPPLPARKISVKARVTENGYFSYEITNAKINAVKERKGRFFSDKEDCGSHGIGLANVREIVEKYGGTLAISHTDTSFTVTVLIAGVN